MSVEPVSAEPVPANSERTTLLDARWVGKGGTGTFTRSLLAGIAQLRPPGAWRVWGPASLADSVWPGAALVPTDMDPARWFGQQAAFRVPPADLVLHPHQTRPLHRLPAATCVLDLIQLRHESRPVRAAMRARLQASIRAARVLFTISASVREELSATFGVDPESVTVLHLPVDGEAAARVAARRQSTPAERVLLSVARFTPHKNHRRLVEAFDRTRFAAGGGRLHLVGGTADELDLGGAVPPPSVRVLGNLDAGGLEDSLAGALALVQASLVEGYGLPVAEALLARLPVVSSPVPAVTEFGPAGVPTFDPMSVTAMAEAIDETVDLIDSDLYWDKVDRASWVATRPSPLDLAREVVDGLSRSC